MRNKAEETPNALSCTFRDSLDTISAAHVRLNLLGGTCATPSLIASKIKLYNVLLDELSEIHAGLARDLKYARKAPVLGRARLHA
jgi:hypothetical protein